MDLVKIESPSFLKSLSLKEMESLAQEIRDFMSASVSKTGGFLASNLTSVELSIGLHRIFNSPTDKILFDAAHQSYTHKILTGRAKDFNSLRQVGGLSGFQSLNESDHDPYEATVLGQALSIGYGLSMKNDADEIITVVTQDSLNQGIFYEALNHMSISKKKVIIIINDSSDGQKIKGLSTSLKNLALAKPITQFRDDMSTFFEKGNVITGPLKRGIKNITTTLSKTVTTTNLFTEMGLRYLGPFDGHKLSDVLRVLSYAKSVDEPIVIHFKTTLGKGYKVAHNELAGRWVDLSDFDPTTGKQKVELPANTMSIEDHVITEIKQIVKDQPKAVVVNTVPQLVDSFSSLKERYYDLTQSVVHSIAFSSGLSLAGFKVILCVESKDIVEGFDFFLSDLAVMHQPMTIISFNSGVLTLDGGYQKGLFDLKLLEQLPYITVVEGKDAFETRSLVQLSLNSNQTTFVRVQDGSYPVIEKVNPLFGLGQWEMLNLEISEPSGILLTYGKSVNAYLEKIVSNKTSLWVVNMRTLKPLDEKTLHYVLQQGKPLYVVTEDYINPNLIVDFNNFKEIHRYDAPIKYYGLDSELLYFGHSAQLKKQAKVDTLSIFSQILQDIEVNTKV